MPEDVLDWTFLTTYGGAALAVLAIVQFTKNLPWIRSIPTRVWAFIVAFMILFLAAVFTLEEFKASDVLLCIISAVVVSMAAVGSYHTVADIKDPGTILEERNEEE